MIPAPVEGAAMQFFIEALKKNTDEVRGLRNDLKEERSMLADVRERVIRIEANRVDRRVERLEEQVDALEKDRDVRSGRLSVGDWIAKNGFNVSAMFVAVLLAVVLVLKATGRL